MKHAKTLSYQFFVYELQLLFIKWFSFVKLLFYIPAGWNHNRRGGCRTGELSGRFGPTTKAHLVVYNMVMCSIKKIEFSLIFFKVFRNFVVIKLVIKSNLVSQKRKVAEACKTKTTIESFYRIALVYNQIKIYLNNKSYIQIKR